MMDQVATEKVTTTDQGGSRWAINDEVIQLREWGTRRVHLLPYPTTTSMLGSSRSATATLGASPSCTFCIDDPRVSREHLQLSFLDGRWIGVDHGSKNGTRVDGLRVRTFVLTPGCEIRTGGVTMFAESANWIRLRQFLCRILGWADDQAEAVDLALRSIRTASLGRGALYLSGAGDLAQIAVSLHRYVWGAKRPFVMSDPRRNEGEESVRTVANYRTGMEALAAARRGTLCIRAVRPPPDLDDVLRHLAQPGLGVLLVIVDAERGFRYAADATTNPEIRIPPIAARTDELWMVIDEFATAAAEELALPPHLFTAEDRDWVREHAAHSLPEIEKATQRLLALHASRNFSKAAERLCMAPVSLNRWIGRRTLPGWLARKLQFKRD